MMLSVVVPTYRDWGSLGKCLGALASQQCSPEHFEIIVVNNDPERAPPDWLMLPSNARMLTEPRPGSYAARNAGVYAALGEIIAFTDADCVPAFDWVGHAIERFRGEPGLHRVGGAIRLTFKGEPLSWAELYEREVGFRQEGCVADLGVAATANMIARRAVFEQVGPFREDLLSGGDWEWGARAQRMGYPIAYAPECVVEHEARYSFRALAAKSRRTSGGWKLQIARERGRWALLRYVLVEFAPPVKFAARILGRCDLRLGERVAVILVWWALKLVMGWEKTLLVLSLKQPERR